MKDSEKLKLLANWFDLRDKEQPIFKGSGTEVQTDLRRIARSLEIDESITQVPVNTRQVVDVDVITGFNAKTLRENLLRAYDDGFEIVSNLAGDARLGYSIIVHKYK